MTASGIVEACPEGTTSGAGPIGDRAGRGLRANFIVAVANQGSVFLSALILARLLGREDFGKLAIIQSTITSLAMIAQSGTGYTATKYIAEYRIADPMRAGRIMKLCSGAAIVSAACFTAILIIMAPLIAGAGLHKPELTTPLCIGAIALFFTSINGYQCGALAGFEAFGRLAMTSTVNGVFGIAAVAIGTWLRGVEGALFGLAAAAALRCLTNSGSLRAEARRQGLPARPANLRLDQAILWRFALPVILAGYYTSFMVWTVNTILVRESGYTAIALYAAAMNVKAIASFVPTNVVNVVSTSILNNIRSTCDSGQYERWFKRNAIYMVAATLAVGCLMIPFARPVLGLFGRDFGVGRSILLVALGTAVIEAGSTSLYQLIQNHERMWQSLLAIAIPRDSILLFAACLLIPRLGATGLAAAGCGSALIGLLLTSLLCNKIWRNRRRTPSLGRTQCEIEVANARIE